MEKIDIKHALLIKASILKKSNEYTFALVACYVTILVFASWACFRSIVNPVGLIQVLLEVGTDVNPMFVIRLLLPFAVIVAVLHCMLALRVWVEGGWPWKCKRRELDALNKALMEGRMISDLEQDRYLKEHLDCLS